MERSKFSGDGRDTGVMCEWKNMINGIVNRGASVKILKRLEKQDSDLGSIPQTPDGCPAWSGPSVQARSTTSMAWMGKKVVKEKIP